MTSEESKEQRDASTKSAAPTTSEKGQTKKKKSQPELQSDSLKLVFQEPIQDLFVDGCAAPVEVRNIFGEISTVRFNLWANHTINGSDIKPVVVSRVVMNVDQFVSFVVALNAYYQGLCKRDESVKKIEDETIKSIREAAARAGSDKK